MMGLHSDIPRIPTLLCAERFAPDGYEVCRSLADRSRWLLASDELLPVEGWSLPVTVQLSRSGPDGRRLCRRCEIRNGVAR